MKNACVLAAIGILLPSPALAKPSTPSAKFLVSQGAAAYEIPLAIPPGTGGVAPTLSVGYTSQGGESLLGTGFSLSGLSQIVRCPATLLQDGFSGAVSYDGNDRFCLESAGVSDGRLVPAASSSGSYFAPGSTTTYHTEVETFRKVVPSQQACGSGPCSFDVWLKDGSHLTYAAAVPAVAAGGASIPAGSVRAWQLSSVTDLHGNAYAVTYSQKPTDVSGKPVSGTAGAGMRYPVRIDYTSGARGLVAQRSVQFYYEAWPGAPPQYEGGAVFTRTARLAEIQTCIDARAIGGKSCAAATLVGRYVMSYASNAPPGRSWLSSFKECDGKGNCLPPVRFEWTPDTKQLVQQQASGRSVLNATTYVGDFDGNGRTDILAVNPGAAQVLLRQATGFQSAPNTGLKLNAATTVWVADFNGDGRTDVFAVGSSDALYISTGRFAGDRPGFSSIPVSNVKLLAYTFIGDVNGDGKADVLTAEGSVGWLYLSTGSGFVKQPNIAGLTLFGANKTWLADFNGDSMADLLTEVDGKNVLMYRSTGTGFNTPGTRLQLDVSGAFTYVGDFNGDGLNDVLSANGRDGTLSAGTGAGFVAFPLHGLAFEPNNNWIGDFNDDGRADVLSVGSGGATLQIANGLGFDSHPIKGLVLTPGAIWVGDFNGDGLTDVTSFQGSGYWDALASPSERLATTNQRPGFVHAIENRLGGQIQISYQPITDPAVYTADAQPGLGQVDNKAATNRYHAAPLSPNMAPLYPVGALLQRAGLYVVASYVLTNDGAVNGAPYYYKRAFTYGSAATSLLGRGFLGFGTITRLEPELRALKTQSYRQDFPFDRELRSVTVADATSRQVLKTTSYDFQCVDGLTLGPCRVDNSSYSATGSRLLNVTLKTQTAVDATLGTKVGRTTTYDKYGNASLVVDSGDLSGSAKAVYTCRTFANDFTRWRLGYPLFSQTSTADCSAAPTTWAASSLRLKQLVRDPSTLDVVASVGWLEQKRQWRGKTSWRDGWGNVISRGMLHAPTVTPTTPAASETVYTTTYDAIFHSFRTAVRSPIPNSSSGPLLTRYATDVRFGRELAVGRPDGTFSVHCVDGFGRPVIRQGPPPDASVIPRDPLCLAAASYVTGSPGLPGSVVTLATKTWEQATGATIANTTSRLRSFQTSTGSPRRPSGAPATSWATVVAAQDGLSRTVQATRTSDTAAVVTSTSFLTPGKLVSHVSSPHFSSTPPQQVPGASWSYDPLGRTIARTAPYTAKGNQPASTVTTWARAAGDTTTVTRATSTSESYVEKLKYDYFGTHRRLVGASVRGTSIARTYGYTRLGEARTTTGPIPVGGSVGVTVTQTYDSLGRTSTITEGGLGTRTLTYDENGKLHTITDALGQVYQRAYDPLQRLIGEQWKNPSGTPMLRSKWTWDTGRGTHLKGRVASVTLTDAVSGAVLSETRYGYDGQGRVSERTVTIDGKTSTVRTKYIPGGATQALTYPDGATAAWTYTPLGAMSTIQTSNPALGTTVYSGHTPTSQAQHVAYGNGATADLTYDASGIPQTRVLRDARGNAVVAEAYVRDGLFRVVQAFDCLATANAANALCAPTGVRATNTTDLTRSFTYSDLRLKSATLGRTNYNLGYDAAGNLYQINGNTLPVSGQQLACNGSHAPSSCYDANGSLLSAADRQASRTYGYDAANRLRSASKGGTRLATFGYDHLGERRTKTTYAADGVTVAGTTTWPSTHYSTWAGPAGAHPQHTVYVPGPTGPVASFTVADTTRGAPTRTTGPTPERATASSGAVAFYAQDDTLSTRVVTDGSGQLVARVDYGPYGDVAAISPSGANPGPNLFGGHVFDFETGLYQYGARYYDPRVGRFITPDDRMGGPLERQDAFHRYAFALNDPTTYVDLSGHRGCMALGVALGGVTGAFAFIGTILGAKDETARDKAAVAFTSIGALLGTAVTVGGGSWAVCTYYRDRVARQAREAREDAEDRAHRRADADDPDDADPVDDNPLQTLGGDGEIIEAELMNTVAPEAPVALRTATPEAEVMSVVEPKPTEATGLQTSAVEAEDEVVEEVFEDLALDALVDL